MAMHGHLLPHCLEPGVTSHRLAGSGADQHAWTKHAERSEIPS